MWMCELSSTRKRFDFANRLLRRSSSQSTKIGRTTKSSFNFLRISARCRAVPQVNVNANLNYKLVTSDILNCAWISGHHLIHFFSGSLFFLFQDKKNQILQYRKMTFCNLNTQILRSIRRLMINWSAVEEYTVWYFMFSNIVWMVNYNDKSDLKNWVI